MAFLRNTEVIVSVAFWTGTAALALMGALLLWLLSMRLWSLVQQKLRERTLLRWRPLLMSSFYAQPETLPPLSRFDVPHVLELWNHLHESLNSEAQNSLSQMAGQARIPVAVSLMLSKKSFHARLLAARTAGNLRLVSAWDLLREQLASDSPALSLAAARALTQIDATRAVPLLVTCLVGRNDWHPGDVADILHIADVGQMAQSLHDVISALPADQAGRLIRLLAKIASDQAVLIGKRILVGATEDDQLLNTCLDVLNTPEELEAVRALARHADWHVRVHAAKALGRLGAAEDEALLEAMLVDGQWWVRYRAAQALSQLPGMNAGKLLRIKDMQTDRDARDMLHQVMAELELREACMAAQRG